MACHMMSAALHLYVPASILRFQHVLVVMNQICRLETLVCCWRVDRCDDASVDYDHITAATHRLVEVMARVIDARHCWVV